MEAFEARRAFELKVGEVQMARTVEPPVESGHTARQRHSSAASPTLDSREGGHRTRKLWQRLLRRTTARTRQTPQRLTPSAAPRPEEFGRAPYSAG